MDKHIFEPILVYVKDTGEFRKYSTKCSAEIALECYDIDNYEAYDGKYRELKIIPSKNGGVSFELTDYKKIYDKKIFKYTCDELIALAQKGQNHFDFLDTLIQLLPSIAYKC